MGWRRGSVVPLKPGNPGGGKGTSVQGQRVRSSLRAGGLTMSLAPTLTVKKLQEALQAKAKSATQRIASMPCTTRCIVSTFSNMRWRVARENRGGFRVWTGQTFEDIEKYGEEKWLGELAEELRKKTYRPQPVRRGVDPEAGREATAVGRFPAIRDRVVQMAAVLILEPIFESRSATGAHTRTDRTAARGCNQSGQGLGEIGAYRSGGRGLERLFRQHPAQRA